MFDIPLCGEGTGSVEALPSYLHRCAYHHGVSTSKFLEYLHQEIKMIGCEEVLIKPSNSITMESLITAGLHSDRYIGIIYKLTGRKLFDTTFYKMQSIITRPKLEIIRNTRWCPECFKESRQVDSEPYIKLIWFLNDITHCSIHRTPLLDACTHCGEHQNSIARTLPLDICHACNGNLKDRSISVEADMLPSWLNQGEDLINLIASLISHKENIDACELNGLIKKDYGIMQFRRVSAYSGAEQLRQGLDQSIRDFSTRCTDPEYDHAYKYCWTNKEIRYQIWSSAALSLKTLRIFAFLTHVEIYDLITGNFIRNTRAMSYLWSQSLPKFLMKNKKRIYHDHARNFESLQEFITNSEPLSLKEISRRTGIDIGYIQYRFPEIKQKIVTRYQQHIDNISLEKHHQANLAAFRYFNGDAYAGCQKSRKQALKKLMEDTSLTRMYLKPAIQKAYSKYVNCQLNELEPSCSNV